MCEGADLTLSAAANVNGAEESFTWSVNNGYPHLTNDADAYFIDVLPEPPLTSATVVSGVATVMYSNYPGNFSGLRMYCGTTMVLQLYCPRPASSGPSRNGRAMEKNIQAGGTLLTGADSLAGGRTYMGVGVVHGQFQ